MGVYERHHCTQLKENDNDDSDGGGLKILEDVGFNRL